MSVITKKMWDSLFSRQGMMTKELLLDSKGQNGVRLSVGSRVYEMHTFFQEGERKVSFADMRERVKALSCEGAFIGEEDVNYIAEHLTSSDELGRQLERAYFLAPLWSDPNHPNQFAYLCGAGAGWWLRWEDEDEEGLFSNMIILRRINK